jgi:hypothetical protein
MRAKTKTTKTTKRKTAKPDAWKLIVATIANELPEYIASEATFRATLANDIRFAMAEQARVNQETLRLLARVARSLERLSGTNPEEPPSVPVPVNVSPARRLPSSVFSGCRCDDWQRQHGHRESCPYGAPRL